MPLDWNPSVPLVDLSDVLSRISRLVYSLSSPLLIADSAGKALVVNLTAAGATVAHGQKGIPRAAFVQLLSGTPVVSAQVSGANVRIASTGAGTCNVYVVP